MTGTKASTGIEVLIDGQKVPSDVPIVSVVVDDNLHRPDTFAVTFHDAARIAVKKAHLKVGAAVTIKMGREEQGGVKTLLKGEITAIEAEIHAGLSTTIVRGYDQSHRLFRGRVTANYLNMTYADVARKVAQRAGLKPGKIESTSPTFKQISQANESDWDFLWRLAGEVGFDLLVADGKLDFGKPTEAKSGGAGSSRRGTTGPLELHAGANLMYLRATVTAADQVEKVSVRGWDVAAKKAVVAEAPAKTSSARNGSSPAEMAKAFGAPPLVSTNVPYARSREVELAAKALAEQVASGFSELEGQALGNVALRAGAVVKVGFLGEPFDGSYVLTSTRHTYDVDDFDGYVTNFTISGRQERSLLGLVGGGSAGSSDSRISGVVPALVNDINDPDKQLRVRLTFPWMSDDYVSDWSRVAQVGAGKDRGFVVMPEVGDEVLVAFEQGDMRRPYVVGGLYNGKDTAKTGPGQLFDGSTKAVNYRLFTSRLGHNLVFVDSDKDAGVTLATGDGKIVIRLNQAKKVLEVESGGDLTINVKGNVKLEAKGNLDLTAAQVKIKASSSLSLEGAQVSIKGSGPVQVKGQPIQLN
jgi:phage protein D/phage baseplate assembly protein gpV